MKLPKKNIDFLILTHTHFDHCQNANVIKEQYQNKIIAREREIDFLQQGYTPLPNGTFAISRFIAKMGNRIGKSRFGYQTFIPDMRISGETIFEGFPIQLISTTGHSKGSVSIIVDNEIALVSDTIFGIFRKSVFSPFADNVRELVKSWGRLLKTNYICFLPGHGKEILQELLQREFDKLIRK